MLGSSYLGTLDKRRRGFLGLSPARPTAPVWPRSSRVVRAPAGDRGVGASGRARPLPARADDAGRRAVLVALGLSACGSPSPPARGAGSSTTGASQRTTTTKGGNAPSGHGTQEVGFDPYTPQGTVRATLQVTRRCRGRASHREWPAPRPTAASPQPGSSIYDPCFAPAHATSGPLTCVAAPTDIDAVAFDVGALPSAPAGAPASRPWAMRLVSGQVCVLVAAAWGGLGPFACPTPRGGGLRRRLPRARAGHAVVELRRASPSRARPAPSPRSGSTRCGPGPGGGDLYEADPRWRIRPPIT